MSSDIFPIDVDAMDAIAGVHTEAKTAAEALSIAAEYMRARKRLPPSLEDYLAEAFEVTALKEKKHQGTALLRELGIEAQNRRPVAATSWEVAEYVDDAQNGTSERQRILGACQYFGISATTARRLLPDGRAAWEDHARDQAEHAIRKWGEENAKD